MRTALFALAIAACTSACNGSTSRTEQHAPPVGTTSTALTRPTITWPAQATAEDRALLSLLGDGTRDGTRTEGELRALVGRSVVPVLAPRELRLASPTLVVEGEFFTLTGRVDNPSGSSRATVSLQGTRAAHRYEDIEPVNGNRSLRGTRGFVSVNEGVRTASWIENGAAYSVDVECSDVHEARCESEDFLLSVVAQLTFVGGLGR